MYSDVLRSASTSVVFPAPDGAESTKRIPLRVNRLLKVLNLFADFFQLGFADNDALRNRSIVCLGAESVQFAKNFLGNELEGASDRFVSPKVMRELSEMTFHAGQLFGNVRAIGEESNFSHQTLVLRGNGKTSFMNAFQKCGPIFSHDIGMQSADLFDLFAHRL